MSGADEYPIILKSATKAEKSFVAEYTDKDYQKVSILSLGCAKNLVHSETMMGIFEEQGFELTEEYDKAEIMLYQRLPYLRIT